MLDPQASRFWQATLLSGLMDAQGLTACWEAIAVPKRDFPEHIDRRLARQAVQLKLLTLWQAQQLLAGRTTGFKVDRYTLLDLIGQGGMGRVYLARDTRLNRQVALKILSPERMSNPRAIARFQREARVGAQLQHENLVRIYDFGESSGRYYLVMEYIEGKTIGTLIAEQGCMPPATAVRLVRQVALGLEHAHRKGLIHRDVNPYNVLVTRDGTAKLADLGLAIDLAEDDHVTRDGATVGTFDYVSPEQARHSHSVDIRSDIYSLGCTLYHMCAGQVPFPGPSLPEKLFAHQGLEPTPLEELVPGLPEGLGEIVRRMMRKSPDDRFATPLHVVQVLEQYADETPFTLNNEGAALVSPAAEAARRRSPQPTFDPAHESAPPAAEVEPPPPLIKTIAALDRPETPPITMTETGSGPVADAPAAPPDRPHYDYGESDPDFPLFVDLDPDLLLRDGLSRNRPSSGAARAVSATGDATSARRFGGFPLWGLTALATTVVVAVTFLAWVKPFDPTPAAGSLSGSSIARNQKVVPKLTKPESPATPPRIPAAPIVVRTEGGHEQEFPASKLFDAMQTAMGSHGWVELGNREPIRLTGEKPLNFISARGRLLVRAAPGTQPIIESELKGPIPLLTTGSGVSLELSGLTFNLSYPQTPALPAPAAVIKAAGSAKIDRCAFNVVAATHPKGSRAVVSEGGVLDVNRSWFRGFDETFQVIAMNSTPARIRQTMIVPASSTHAAEAQSDPWYGWGVKLQLGTAGAARKSGATRKSGAAPPHLILESCTVESAGVIDVTPSTPASALDVEVNHCAIRAEALVACNRDVPPSSQIRWRGEGNQYDILGRVWIVLSAREGTPSFSTTVTDLPGWQLFAPGDIQAIAAKLIFMTEPAARPEWPQPRAFQVQASMALPVKPGAKAELVGPWSSP